MRKIIILLMVVCAFTSVEAQTTVVDNKGGNVVVVSNATHTGDVTGATVLTLATVNNTVGTFTNSTVTTNGKGLITNIVSGTAPGVYTGLAPINVTGTVISADTSTANTGLVNKSQLTNSISNFVDKSTNQIIGGFKTFSLATQFSDIIYGASSLCLGGALSPSSFDLIKAESNNNGFTKFGIKNVNAGINAGVGITFQNDAGNIFQNYMGSTNNAFIQDGSLIRCTGTGGFRFTHDAAASKIKFSNSPSGSDYFTFNADSLFYKGVLNYPKLASNLTPPATSGITKMLIVDQNGMFSNAPVPTGTVETDPIVRAVNGIVKSDGLNISAASPIYDYLQPNGSANALTNFPQFPESQITGLVNDLAGKQATLVSGQNSSTVNGESLIDGHNIVVGGGGGTVLPAQPSTVYNTESVVSITSNETLFDSYFYNPGTTNLTITLPTSPQNGTIFILRFGGTIASGSPVFDRITFTNTRVYGILPIGASGGNVYSFRYNASNNLYYYTKTN